MAVNVGNFRVLAYPKTAVYAASEMLGEMPVEFGPHHARLLGEIDTDPLIGGRRREALPTGQDGSGSGSGSKDESAA
jgi:hypothetical protein